MAATRTLVSPLTTALLKPAPLNPVAPFILLSARRAYGATTTTRSLLPIRYSNTTPIASYTTTSTTTKQDRFAKAPVREPSYELTFTCVPCSGRSTHTITKQGYHYGSVLIACPTCRNRHVISDHLNIFGNRNITVEDLLKEKGEFVKKGTLGEDGDIEFWADGSITSRTERNELPPKRKPAAEADENAPETENPAPGSTFKSVGGKEEGG